MVFSGLATVGMYHKLSMGESTARAESCILAVKNLQHEYSPGGRGPSRTVINMHAAVGE